MKKLILVVMLLVAVAGGYYVVTHFLKLDIEALSGDIASVRRGDLVVPITASGNIKAASVTQIKSKASGEVIDIPVELGDMVSRGQLLIDLLDVDERRRMEQAQATHEQAKITCDTAKITLERRLPAAVKRATASLEQAQAQAMIAKSKYDFYFPKRPRPGFESPLTEEDWVQMESALKSAQAAELGAQAELDDANTAIELGKQDVKKAEEAVKSAEAALNDAKQRLKETKIYSPIDGMVLDKKVQVGEVVQGGQMTLMGGTVLMEVADVSEIFAVVNVDEADIGQVRDLAPVLTSQPATTRPSEGGVGEAAARAGSAKLASDSPDKPADVEAAGPIQRGQDVTVTVETFPDEKFTGRITRISPQSEVQQAVATFRVWIRLTGENSSKLKKLLNLQAEARFTAHSAAGALLVSYDAIQRDPRTGDYGVYVPDLDPVTKRNKPKFVACTLGATDGIDIEVKSGLKEGDRIYTKLPLKTKRDQEEEDSSEGG